MLAFDEIHAADQTAEVEGIEGIKLSRYCKEEIQLLTRNQKGRIYGGKN